MPFLLIILTFGFLLKILYGTLAPYRDSGDLVASAFSLGIAHPPGYCFYTLLTKMGMLIFHLGNFAYRTNLLSSLWTSITVGILFMILRKSHHWSASLLALTIWFLSPSVIRLSIVSEMYSLISKAK